MAAKRITVPEWLSDEAKKEYKRIYKLLADENKDFKPSDLAALEGYAKSYAKWKEAEEILDREGFTYKTVNGYTQQRPEVAIANKAQQEYRSWMKELCLTEASRARTNKNKAVASPKDSYNAEDIEMEKMFNE